MCMHEAAFSWYIIVGKQPWCPYSTWTNSHKTLVEGILATTTSVSRPLRNRTFFVYMARVWNDLNISWCVPPVAFTVAIWKQPWRPMTWCLGSSSPMPLQHSSTVELQNRRCLRVFCWRWKKIALKGSMIPWSNVLWSPNQWLGATTKVTKLTSDIIQKILQEESWEFTL